MTRKAWLWVIGGYVVMAIGFVIFAFILSAHVRDLEQTKTALSTVAVHNAGAICLGLTAPTKEKEMALVDAFLEGDGAITDQFTPLCARVAERAASDIFTGSLPASLQQELNRAKR